MRRFPFLAASLAAVVLFSAAVRADYIEVQRSAIIKDQPARDAAEIVRPATRDRFSLLDEGRQTGGYYHVSIEAGAGDGWIYRTFVRRFPGALPGAAPAPGSATPSAATEPAGDTMRVHYLDVGQGAAAIIEFACGAVMVDAGGENADTDNQLLKYLSDFFDRRADLNRKLDAIFITHTHKDHNRALELVVEKFTVKNYVHNGLLNGSGSAYANWMVQHGNDNNRHIKLRPVTEAEIDPLPKNKELTDKEIDPVDCAGTDPKIGVLSASRDENPGWPEKEFDNGNNHSLVIRIDFGSCPSCSPETWRRTASTRSWRAITARTCSTSTSCRSAITGRTTARQKRCSPKSPQKLPSSKWGNRPRTSSGRLGPTGTRGSKPSTCWKNG